MIDLPGWSKLSSQSTEELEAIIERHQGTDPERADACNWCRAAQLELARRKRPHGEPGTVDWLVAELMRYVVMNQGHLPVRLCVPGQIPHGPDIDRPIKSVVAPDSDHPTVELWGNFS